MILSSVDTHTLTNSHLNAHDEVKLGLTAWFLRTTMRAASTMNSPDRFLWPGAKHHGYLSVDFSIPLDPRPARGRKLSEVKFTANCRKLWPMPEFTLLCGLVFSSCLRLLGLCFHLLSLWAWHSTDAIMSSSRGKRKITNRGSGKKNTISWLPGRV